MSFGSQTRLLRIFREVVFGDMRQAIPFPSSPKPDFSTEISAFVPLPRSTPEDQGVASKMLNSFYNDISAIPSANVHSIMAIRNGKVISEGYFSPYRKGVWHVTHSLCKSFTGTAVGIAVSEGLLGLDAEVVRYFPEHNSLLTPKRIKAITVRQLLNMSGGVGLNEFTHAAEQNWVKGLFANDAVFEPGSKFTYNSMSSFMLSALVCKVSGQSLMDYLHPRLFEPLGFGPVGWEKSPDGIEKGGWGMYVLPEDMAKLGLLYLNKGQWIVNGLLRQILPVNWVEDATKTQMKSNIGEEYGFQIWTDETTGNYMMNGMFGQYVTVMPRQNLIIGITSGSPHFSAASAVNTLVKDYFQDVQLFSSLPAAPRAVSELRKTEKNLRYSKPLPAEYKIPVRKRTSKKKASWGISNQRLSLFPSGSIDKFCDKTWTFSKNRAILMPLVLEFMDNRLTGGIEALRFETQQDTLVLYWQEDGETYIIPAGYEKGIESVLKTKEESFLISSFFEMYQNEDLKMVLCVSICFLEHSSMRKIKVSYRQNKLVVMLDEAPQLLELMDLDALKGITGADTPDFMIPMMHKAQNNDLVRFKIDQLCAPTVIGTLKEEL